MSREKNKKSKRSFAVIFPGLALVISYLAYFSARWCKDKYGDIGFDAVLFTMFSDLTGTSESLVMSYIKSALPPTVFLSVITLFILFFFTENGVFLRIGERFKLKLYPFGDLTSSFISVMLSVALILSASNAVQMNVWLKGVFSNDSFFEEEYIDPDTVKISFPENKRNLIYIYLESMEKTFFSKELGGALDYNVIPELYSLAESNINFSNTAGVGGCRQISGATWTIGAMVAQSAGIPLKIPVDGNTYGDYSEFLPGVTTLTDILHENGYRQMFLIGSDSSFGGRNNYYSQHGTDDICDYYTAQRDGIIDSDYYVWWGMEDKYLYEYAKQKLTELSARNEPFSFITLTTDTHHIGGYICSLCTNRYSEQYENAYACAARQLTAFVKWIKQQDFYENTTVIITGDHCSMDAEYFSRAISSDYERRIYNCFINSAVTSDSTKNREFSQFDMFPATLAALGAKIEGDRLGLGVNLFADGVATLAEKYGFNELEGRLLAHSNMYDKKFLYANG